MIDLENDAVNEFLYKDPKITFTPRDSACKCFCFPAGARWRMCTFVNEGSRRHSFEEHSGR